MKHRLDWILSIAAATLLATGCGVDDNGTSAGTGGQGGAAGTSVSGTKNGGSGTPTGGAGGNGTTTNTSDLCSGGGPDRDHPRHDHHRLVSDLHRPNRGNAVRECALHMQERQHHRVHQDTRFRFRSRHVGGSWWFGRHQPELLEFGRIYRHRRFVLDCGQRQVPSASRRIHEDRRRSARQRQRQVVGSRRPSQHVVRRSLCRPRSCRRGRRSARAPAGVLGHSSDGRCSHTTRREHFSFAPLVPARPRTC